MNLTEQFLREAIQTVRNVMGFNTGGFSDSDLMTMKGPVIAALVQVRMQHWIHDQNCEAIMTYTADLDTQMTFPQEPT